MLDGQSPGSTFYISSNISVIRSKDWVTGVNGNPMVSHLILRYRMLNMTEWLIMIVLFFFLERLYWLELQDVNNFLHNRSKLTPPEWIWRDSGGLQTPNFQFLLWRNTLFSVSNVLISPFLQLEPCWPYADVVWFTSAIKFNYKLRQLGMQQVWLSSFWHGFPRGQFQSRSCCLVGQVRREWSNNYANLNVCVSLH